jgi:hypothetical protein
VSKLIQQQREHVSYQTANSTTNTKVWNKGIVIKRFGVHSLECKGGQTRFPLNARKMVTHRMPLFFARTLVLDAETPLPGTRIL